MNSKSVPNCIEEEDSTKNLGPNPIDSFVAAKCVELGIDYYKQQNFLVIFNKTDIVSGIEKNNADQSLKTYSHLFSDKPTVSLISCRTEHGIPHLLENLSSLVKKRVASHTNEPIFISRERHRQLLTSANQHLKIFIGMDESMVVEAAEELRLAADSIGKITGYIDTQQVLTQIFSQFCIGK
ncbi:tRNA modification GTPase MnmE [Smittium culicis]|uniref:tRNA modification GTPase MnmE n=1 Tax=Smittium culicis TaxID=133412 RepID=A0A1R1YTS5_9FUNG|nr:tRNA modification GTPase MnmE [Smittium culicis]